MEVSNFISKRYKVDPFHYISTLISCWKGLNWLTFSQIGIKLMILFTLLRKVFPSKQKYYVEFF